MAKNDIYQLKVTLRGSKPPIWRRLEVPANIRLNELHEIIQAAMGWWNAHLHQFIIGHEYYGQPHPDFGMDDMLDESKYRLDQMAPAEKSKFIYEYDFGDSWEHEILVEKIAPPEPGVKYPRCIKGRRACPPEDVGGVWGYGDFLEAIEDPTHPSHEDMLEWVGEEFDPEAFDIDEVNGVLRSLS